MATAHIVAVIAHVVAPVPVIAQVASVQVAAVIAHVVAAAAFNQHIYGLIHYAFALLIVVPLIGSSRLYRLLDI